MTFQKSDYILGSEDFELARLGYQHRMFASETYQSWSDANFRFGQHLLDLGCGPGYASQELAQMVGPTGKITAIDSSEKYINFIQQQISTSKQNIEPQLADLTSLSLAENQFDGAFARMVMIFLKDPESLVKKIYKSLKPGASFVSMDFAGYYPYFSLNPNGKIFSKVVQAISQSFNQSGLDIHAQKKMPEFMIHAGFQVTKITPILKTARPGQHLWDWAPTLFTTFMPKLIELGLLTREDEQNFWQEWHKHAENKSSYYLTPLLIAVIGTKN